MKKDENWFLRWLCFFLLLGCSNQLEVLPSKVVSHSKQDSQLICLKDEVVDSRNGICWSKCLLGVDYINGKCRPTIPQVLEYDKAIAECKKIKARLPTVKEFETVLGNCHDIGKGGWRKCNKCEESGDCEKLSWPFGPLHGISSYWATGTDTKDGQGNARHVFTWSGLVKTVKQNEKSIVTVCVRDPR